MTYGVTIDGTDTMTEWGLILLDDLTVGTPEPVIKLVEVPGVSKPYDFTEVLGSVTYRAREISFTLFARVQDPDLKTIRDEMATRFHGKRVELVLPDDTTVHYEGRMVIGGVEGYNTGKIHITMTADPETYPEG